VIVLDASAVLEMLLRRPLADWVEELVLSGGKSLHSPHLIDLEIAQALRRYTLSRELTPKRAEEAIGDFLSLPINKYPHDLFLWRIWKLRASLTAYDAAYVALAEALSAPLLTCDQHLARSQGHSVTVQLLKNSDGRE
jgi:predicted nucleic acid-binding protein